MTGKLDLETRLTAALADTARRNLPDGTAVPPFRRPVASSDSGRRPAGSIRAWAVPALVAVVVVALAVGVVVLTNRGQHRGSQAAGGQSGTFVTLRARSAGLSAAELDKARQIIIARAAGLGAPNADVQVVGSNEITAFLPGVAAKDVGDLVAVAAFEFRPLIVDPVTAPASPTSGSAAPSARPAVDPWKSLGFRPPRDAAAYSALSTARQGAVRAVLHGWNCANVPLDRADTPMVACDQSRTMKYLLGAAIISGKDVQAASASPPTLSAFPWQVIVDLKAAGQQLWTDYTAKHNESVHPGDLTNVVADTLDGTVLVASTIQSTINGVTAIAGNFDQRSATLLADSITGGALPAPFDVVSIQSR
jgi:preprotein translocase subunit SecD